MRINVKSIARILVLTIISLVTVSTVSAVPNPGAISWSASPNTFVRSLYAGVLGRAPENNQVVTAWARRVNSNPTSRWNTFFAFTRSAEYRNSRWARQRKSYYLYQRLNRNDTYSYTVSKGPLRAEWRPIFGRTTFGIAAALRGYYQTFSSRR